ncbi:MAG TPA: hypothetical protein VHA35_15755 [Dongiaceae bacterium]|nr:hypothetical protein [Dongiaceae bacterium]
MPMTVWEHQEFQKKAYADKLVVGVDRIFARRFYTNTSVQKMRSLTGEPVPIAKAAVMLAFIIGPLLVVAASVLTFMGLEWWGLLAVPAGIVVYIYYQGLSVLGRSRLTPISIITMAAIAVSPFGILPVRIAESLCCFSAALWCGRFQYVGSTFFVRALIIRNVKAFNALEGELVIRED